MILYHGTIQGSYDRFKPWTFFTDSLIAAEQYGGNSYSGRVIQVKASFNKIVVVQDEDIADVVGKDEDRDWYACDRLLREKCETARACALVLKGAKDTGYTVAGRYDQWLVADPCKSVIMTNEMVTDGYDERFSVIKWKAA